jgi:hypothetical protein
MISFQSTQVSTSPWRSRIATAFAALVMLSMPAFARMTAAEFTAGKARLVDEERAATARCATSAAAERHACEVSAITARAVALAELHYRRSTKSRNGVRLLIAKAEAIHAVEKERCTAEIERASCISAAAQTLAGSLKRANDQWVGGQAELDAATDARQFEFEDAMARCVSRAGSSEVGCRKSLGWQFGQ